MRPLALLCSLTVLASCTGERGPGTGPQRDRIMRVPGEPLVVQRLAPDASGAWRPGSAIPCGTVRCLVTRPDAVGVVDGDVLWVRAAGDDDGQTVPLQPTSADERPHAAVAWARAAAAGLVQEDAVRPGSSRPAPPSLPPELRTCGTIRGGGGVGYHIIRNQGDVWQRIAWVIPPTAADILALPADAYPIVDGAGVVCGFGEQRRGERRWTVHQVKSDATVEAIPDREHVPASCGADGAVLVETAGGPMRVGADGSVGPGPPPVLREAQVGLEDKSILNITGGTVSVARPTGSPINLVFAEGVALDGTAVPAGLGRDRVILVGDGARHLAVVERFVGPLSGLEVLHIVRVDGDAPQVVTTPVRADVVIARLVFALGGFWWVEAPAVAMRLPE